MQAKASTFPRIAIIGGGPGGLTLARTLQVHGIQATVYESDPSPLARPQGGTLDLHMDGAQLALERAELTAEFLKVARYEDQGSRLYDHHGKLWFEESEVSEDRPEVDRTQLRQILLDSLSPETIRWDRKLKEVRRTGEGTYELVFENGNEEFCDLVVGADGAWSRVRPLVTGVLPVYSGYAFVELGIDDVDRSHPQLAALVGSGKMFALGESRALIAQRNSNSHFRVYAALRLAAPKDCGLDLSSPEAAKKDLLTRYTGWAPELLELIRSAGDWVVPRPLYALPVGHRWENLPGVTLLGDAAHLMSPFGGEGVNLAMRDASDLGLALADSLKTGGDWHEAIAIYEAQICQRAAGPAAGAAEGLAGIMAPDALKHALGHFKEIMAEGQTR